MPIKKETLKLIRIRTRPFYIAKDQSDKPVTGYLNNYNEFNRWDIENSDSNKELTAAQREDFTIDGIESPAPFTFFKRNIEDDDDYKKLVFVIDGLHEPYDRRIHNLSTQSSRIFTQQSSGDMINWGGVLTASPKVYDAGETEEESVSLLFRVNPTNIKINKKKLFKKIRTRGGWAFQHWGPEIGQINIQGTTGNISPDYNVQYSRLDERTLIPVEFDEKPSELNSPAYKAFREIEQWYDEDQDDRSIDRGYLTALQYRDRVYVGHIQDFSFEEKGEQPFQLFYKLTFLIHYDSTNLNSAVTRSSNQISRNAETIALVRSLRGAN